MDVPVINGSAHKSLDIIETPLLIVGAGPAGASLACFLSHPPYSMTGILISAAPTTAQTPRAHITNPAAIECLRDIGLEETCRNQSYGHEYMLHTRWCHSMSGEEYGRVFAWGNDPKRRGDYESATPCRYVDLPQTVLEPILVQRAMFEGWDVRFKTSFVSLKKEADGRILSLIRDNLTMQEYYIRSKYLFGADGARTQVVRELKIPLLGEGGKGSAYNILVRADLGQFMDARRGSLHWIIQPDKEILDFALAGVVRMVRPWNEWLFLAIPRPGTQWEEPTREEWLKRCKEFIGQDDIDVEILEISKWAINELVASHYSDGNVFCLGDAVHRHPPANGLGSNTCIQDAYNLAWKIKYVSHGLASPSLLDSYSLERQPVGAGVISRANQGLPDQLLIWKELGLLEDTVEKRMKIFNGLSDANPEAYERRKKLDAAMIRTGHAYHGLGIEMNHRYESKAVCLDDEIQAGRKKPDWPEDSVEHHLITTYPGHRLPHSWLNHMLPVKDNISTTDLAGHGRFCLLTGIGGEKWIEAAKKVGWELGLEINTHVISWGKEWIDIYRDWSARREIQEDGCILVRPDRFICWRSFTVLDDCKTRLQEVLNSVLGKQVR